MNILEQEDYIKGAPDEMLVGLAQMPTGQFPEFLIVSEIQRRQKMRQSYAASQETPQSTVTDQVVSQAVAEMPPQPMAPPMEMAPPPYETRVVQRGGRRIRKPVRREEQIVGEGIASLNANPDELMNAAMGVPMEEPVRMYDGRVAPYRMVGQGSLSDAKPFTYFSDKRKSTYENLINQLMSGAPISMEARQAMVDYGKEFPELEKKLLDFQTNRRSLVKEDPSLSLDKATEMSANSALTSDARKLLEGEDPTLIDNETRKLILADNTADKGSGLSLFSQAQANQDQGGQALGGDVLGLGVEGRGFDDAKQLEAEDEPQVSTDQNIYSLEDRQSQFGIVGPPAPQALQTETPSLTQDAFNKMMTANQALEGAEIDYSGAREALGGDIDFSENQVKLENIIKDYSARAEAAEKEGNKDAVNFAIAQLGAAYASTGNIGDAIGEASKTAMKLKGKSEKRSDALKGLATQAKIQEQVSKATIGMEESKAKRKQAELLANVGLKEQESIYNLAKLGSDSAINTFKAIELAEYRERALKAQMSRDQVMRLEAAVDLIQSELSGYQMQTKTLEDRKEYINTRLGELYQQFRREGLSKNAEKIVDQ